MSVASMRASRHSAKELDRLLPHEHKDQHYVKPNKTKISAQFVIPDQTQDSEAAFLPGLNKKKIFQKICDWYESWSPDQKKVLLCGLTDACSTTQLESIATSLEPIFHRDFVMQLRKRYPSGHFKKGQKGAKGGKKKSKKVKKKENLLEISESELPVKEAQSIEEMANQLIEEAMREAVLKLNASKDLLSVNTDTLDNLTAKPNISSSQGRPTMKSSSVALLKERKMSPLISQHHNALAGHHLSAIAPLTQSVDSYNSLSAIHNRHRSKIPSSVSISQFFAEERQKAPFQAQLLRLNSQSPLGVRNANIPIQRTFKSVSFFGKNPREGTTFVKPEKSKLTSIFNEQLGQIWQWLEAWQSHERLNLLATVMKMSTTYLLTYMGQCLHQRLQDRVNINWLPDNVLLHVYSYLGAEDLDTCSQVCRRWRFLTANDDLWMNKCQQIGALTGIQDIIQVVHLSNKEREGIDWRMAFSELKEITQETKETIPVPERFAFESGTPLGMTRHNGKFIKQSSSQQESSLSTWKTSPSQGPKIGLGMKLARESEKLKQSYRKQLRAESALAEEESRRMELARLSDGASTKSMYSRPSLGRMMIRRAKGDSTPNNSKANASHSIDQLDVLAEDELSRPVTDWMREQRASRNREADEEQALDVRHDPVLVSELLGKDPTRDLENWMSLADIDEYSSKKKHSNVVVTLRKVRKLMGHMDAVLTFDYDKRRLISGSVDRSVRIWDIRSGRSIHKLLGHKGGVGCLTFDLTTLFTGSWDMSIMVWDLVHFTRLAVLTGHRGSISALKITDDRLFSSSHDGTVRIWSRKYYTCLKILELHTSAIMSMVLDENVIITGSSDRAIKITDIDSFETVKALKGSEPIHRLLLQANLIIAANNNGKVTFWNRLSGEAEACIDAHPGAVINGLSYHEGRFYTAGSDMLIKEWDLLTLTCLRSLRGSKGILQHIKMEEEKFLVSCDSTGTIKIWHFFMNLLSPEEKEEEDVIMAKMVHERDVGPVVMPDE